MLIPAYRPYGKLALKQVRTRPEGAISALRDCFEHTNWIMFREADLEEYTASVTGFIGKRINDVTSLNTTTTHANQKP